LLTQPFDFVEEKKDKKSKKKFILGVDGWRLSPIFTVLVGYFSLLSFLTIAGGAKKMTGLCIFALFVTPYIFAAKSNAC